MRRQVHLASTFRVVGKIAHVRALLVVLAAIEAIAFQVVLVAVAIEGPKTTLAHLEGVHEEVESSPMVAE